jgi:hypothetical protein
MTWLVLMLLGDMFTILFNVLGPAVSGMVGSMQNSTSNGPLTPHSVPPTPMWFLGITVAMCLIDFVAVAGVYYWKRWGFYASVGASAVLVVINIIHATNMLDPLMCLISPALLYATLRLGGENCGWRRLQ